jgi:RNA polymerase sigma factor (sigma-70 family)
MLTSTMLRDLVRQLRRPAADRHHDDTSAAELLERFQTTGDRDAFEAIVRRYGPGVLSACRNVLSSDADVEDAFQATFVILLRQAKRIRQRQALGGWLVGVAHRVALKALRAAARRQRAEKKKQLPVAEPPDVSWREACAILHEELDRMPDKYRLPLILCYLDGKTQDEAAQMLGVNVGALRGRVERGRARLRVRLTKRGVALSAGMLALVTASVKANGPSAHLVRAAISAATGEASPCVAALASAITTGTGWKPLLLLVVMILSAGLFVGAMASRAPEPVNAMPPAPPDKIAEPVKAAPEIIVRGKVVGPDSKPIDGAKLYFDPKQVAATSDRDGAFRVNVPADAPRDRQTAGIVLFARADGYGPDWLTLPFDDHEVTLRMVADDVPLRGRLRDLEGKPVAGVRVELYRVAFPVKGDLLEAAAASLDRNGFRAAPLRELPGEFTALFGSAVTDDDGRFRLTGIGRERLVGCIVSGPGIERGSFLTMTREQPASADGGQIGKTPRRPYAAAFEHLVLPGRTLRGLVREKGTGTPLAGITIRDQQTGVETKTDAEGRYEMRGVPKQSKSPVYAVPPDGSAWFTTSVVVADQPGLGPLTADFDLHRGIPFRGKVTDRDGKPVTAWVNYRAVYPNPHVATLPGGDNFNGFETVSVRTKKDGSFTVALLPGPGAVLISPDKPGFQTALVDPRKFFGADAKTERLAYGDRDSLAIQLGGSASTREAQESYAAIVLVNPAKDAKSLTQDIVLTPAKTIEAEIVDADGQPVKGARVRGLTANTDAWQTQPSATVAVANWNLQRLRCVEVRHDGRKLVGHAELRADTKTPLRIRLQEGGTITGRVLTADGKPWTDAMVFAYGSDRDFASNIGCTVVRTDAEGRFRVEGVIPDLKYLLAVRGVRPTGPEGAIAVDLVLRAGETKDLGNVRLKNREE